MEDFEDPRDLNAAEQPEEIQVRTAEGIGTSRAIAKTCNFNTSNINTPTLL
jgi:hypothetical protein